MNQNINLSNLENKSDKDIQDIVDALRALEEKNRYNKLQSIYPEEGPLRRELYIPHIAFMTAGARCRFRVIMGANRSGKSFTMASEICFHATGLYPEWWEGKILRKPNTIWIVAESGALYRDSLQKLLFGNPGEEIGTGLLPLAEKNDGVGILDWAYMPGTPGGVGSCTIRHKKGHIVSIVIKTNEMSREQFQAAKVSLIAFDEEPKEEIFVECMMRLMGAGSEPGIAMLAYTPMKGYSNVTTSFLPRGTLPRRGHPIESGQNYICLVSWKDTPHLTEEDKRDLLSKIPLNQRDARTEGIPSMGAGKIFPIPEDFIIVQPFKIPTYWPRAYGYDFGTHNTAAVWIAKDPSTNIAYVYAEYKQADSIVSDQIHAQCIKAKGDWIPGACDPSGGGHRDDGKLRIRFMNELGLNMIPGHNALGTGLSSLLNKFESGTLKIFATVQGLLEEIRIYRFDVNNPNVPARNQDDHEIDAMRYCDSIFDQIAVSQNEVDFPFDDYQDSSDNSRDNLTGY